MNGYVPIPICIALLIQLFASWVSCWSMGHRAGYNQAMKEQEDSTQ